MREVTTTRISLTKDEREIAKTYGNDWQRMLAEYRKYGTLYILIGDWSGYRSSQYRYTHVVFMPRRRMKVLDVEADWRDHHRFTDNTNMSMWLQEMSIADIINQKIRSVRGYDELTTWHLKGTCKCQQPVTDDTPPGEEE